MNKITIPGKIKYRISSKDANLFQPQYKRGRKWINCTFPYYDQRDADLVYCNQSFRTLEEAEKYVDELVKRETEHIYYKGSWK